MIIRNYLMAYIFVENEKDTALWKCNFKWSQSDNDMESASDIVPKC